MAGGGEVGKKALAAAKAARRIPSTVPSTVSPNVGKAAEVVYESPLPEGHDVAKGLFGRARIYWPYLGLRGPIQNTRTPIGQVALPELLATALFSY
jgi:hypothetical protein